MAGRKRLNRAVGELGVTEKPAHGADLRTEGRTMKPILGHANSEVVICQWECPLIRYYNVPSGESLFSFLMSWRNFFKTGEFSSRTLLQPQLLHHYTIAVRLRWAVCSVNCLDPGSHKMVYMFSKRTGSQVAPPRPVGLFVVHGRHIFPPSVCPEDTGQGRQGLYTVSCE